MDNSILKAYIQTYLFRKLPWRITITALYGFVIGLILWLSINHPEISPFLTAYTIFALATIIMFVFIFGSILLSSYAFFKKYEYGKDKLGKPEKTDPQFEIKNKLFELEERLKEIERTSPLNSAIFSIFIGIALTLGIAILLYLLPTIGK